MIRAVIFDLDDTLIDTFPHYLAAVRKAVRPYGVDLESLTGEERRNILGLRARDVLAFLIDKYSLPVSLADLHAEYARIMAEVEQKSYQLLPGAAEAVFRLQAAGYLLALVSSNSRKVIDEITFTAGLGEMFPIVISTDDIRLAKPDPEPYRLATQRLGLAPDECAVIEDSDVGIASARAAGCYCVGYRNSHIPRQSFGQTDRIIESLDELTKDFFEQRNNGETQNLK